MGSTAPLRIAGILLVVTFLAAWALDFERDVRDRDGFSWMDPTQYHDFAAALLGGGAPPGGFAVASAFPYVVAPFLAAGGTPGASLRVNLAAALLLALAVGLLARAVGLRSPVAFPVILVLSAPLLLGLSRELYTEFTLTAFVALGFVLWFGTDRFRRPLAAALFGLVFAAGLLLKMTFALFFLGPAAYEAVSALRARETRRLVLLFAATVLPAAAVLLGVRIAAPESFAYYASLGNTRIPIMRLIGPPDLLSAGSLFYYIAETGRTGLWWIAALLVVPIALARRVGGFESGPRRDRLVVLWLWLVVPLAVLTFQPVKEPRHMAPCMVAAVLLIVTGIESVRSKRAHGALAAAAIAIALVQYLGVTRGEFFAPYRLTAPLEGKTIEAAMVGADPNRERYRGAGGGIDIYRWRFTKSIALAGFDPNAALGLTWFFAPAVVYDLDVPQWREERRPAYDRFEDLFCFPAFNTYNRRAGWPHPYFTLTRDQVESGADYLVVRGEGAPPPPSMREIGRFAGGEVRVYARQEPPTSSYREVYAREFLRRATPSDPVERNTIFFSLFMVERLRGRIPVAERLLAGFPDGFRPGPDRRNIYWISHDFPLQSLADQAYRDYLAGRL